MNASTFKYITLNALLAVKAELQNFSRDDL